MSERLPQPGNRVRVVEAAPLDGAEGVLVESGPFAYSVLLDRDAHLGLGGERVFTTEELVLLGPDAAAHSCDNCLGVDPDTRLYNGEKES